MEAAIEIALAVLAADAYRIAKCENKLHQQKFADLYASPAALAPSPGLEPHLPLVLAGLFVRGYLGLAAGTRRTRRTRPDGLRVAVFLWRARHGGR
jgi:hypothetical protein